MATFKTRIVGLIGSDNVSDNEITLHLTDAAADLINSMPNECMWLVADESSAITSNGYALDTCKILGVTRDDESCTLAPMAYENKIKNNPSSMFGASDLYPMFILKEGKLNPSPSNPLLVT